MSRASVRHRNQTIYRAVVLVLVGLFFAIPLYSMFRFSITTQGLSGVRRWDAWKALVEDATLRGAIKTSLELALLTVVGMVVLLVPTMVWTRVRVPWARRIVEFICLIPLTIPAIVLVVGYSSVGQWVNYLVTDGALSLTFPYIILVLPYAYRSLDAGMSGIDVPTLSEAARSLGASWFTVIVRVILPNITSAVVSASFLSVTLVLGEFTGASLLNYVNLQVQILQEGQSNARVSTAASVAVLAFGFFLLLLLSSFSRRRKEATS
jgi:putative spermidine/putrescine transport system permease protein